MECQTSDSKKLFKVFDASKRKRSRKKRGGPDDNSAVTDDSTSGGCRITAIGQVASAKASLQEVRPNKSNHGGTDVDRNRDRDSSPEPAMEVHRTRSPRRTRRATREGLSLALKAGLLPNSRLSSPRDTQNDPQTEVTPREDDSFIYAFLEEAIKRKKKRHSRKREGRCDDDQEEREPRRHRRQSNEGSPSCERRHRKSSTPDQAVLFEAFTKICAQMNQNLQSKEKKNVPRTSSNKSLQCKVESRQRRHEPENVGRKLRSRENSCEQINSPNARSQEDIMRARVRSQDNVTITRENRGTQEQCVCCHNEKYSSKIDVHHRTREKNDRYQDFIPVDSRTRSRFDTRTIREDHCRDGTLNDYYRDYDERRELRHFEDSKRYYDQKTTRSYEVNNRDGYADEDRACRRTARSDNVNKERKYDDIRRLDDKQRYMSRDKLYDDRLEHRSRCAPSKSKCRPKNIYEYDRSSIISRDDDYRDRYSERERDSGLSVADGETSTVSGRSNYLKVVKQEIAEQREAMEKMMKLWKELMKCFKTVSHPQDPNNQDKTINERAENARETAAAQLKLWRECMRRYETVARDVGDTDARLMEEINKQRSEMTEMASMWQECLQRYREISNDFNSLKQKLTSPPSPPRPASTALCAEGEGPPAAPYRAPPGYPVCPTSGYPGGGSPLRPRASAPPPWGWWGEPRDVRRRQSSPDSRGSRERRHRHRERERDDTRYKEKSSKPGATRSEQKHRKR